MNTEDRQMGVGFSGITRIVVFEQNGSGGPKISGIEKYGRDLVIAAVVSVGCSLPEFIDNPERYLSDDFEGDLALDFLKHPDLSTYLADICHEKKIPLVASGKKTIKAITPFTCCGLGRIKSLGTYADQFGLPELEVEAEDDIIASVRVIKGAPCGATWQVLPRMIGLPVSEAISTMAREIQYVCVADPSNFDPVSGKSPLHYAGDVHAAAMKKALGRKGSK